MADNDGLVTDLAGAILDGATIDWETAESGADQTERALLAPLRRLATLADFHRGLPFQWGHLRVLELVGRGAFAEVFRAWDTRLDREVALKLLTPAASPGDTIATSIIEEGRLLARVRHPNVVTIYGADRINDRIGLWMEFVPGRTLEQVLQQGHAFDLTEIVRVGIDLCRAVAAVHDAGLLHRDIKAHNVLMADDGRVVLMDFGTGRELGDRSSGLAGTPLYLGPELFSGEDPTVRSDIYSLGVLLFHLLTGSYPVHAGDVGDLRLAHERHERTDVGAALRGISSKLARIIERALDPRPEHRYQSAHALEAALATLKPRPRLVRFAYAAGVAAVLTLIIGGGWEIVGRLTGTRTPSTLITGWHVPGVFDEVLALNRLKARRQRLIDPDVYERYLKARLLTDSRSTPVSNEAVKLFTEVMKKEPSFAPAYAGLADAYARISMGYTGGTYQAAYDVMRFNAGAALELDSESAEAHAAMGQVHARELDWANAERSFQWAIMLDPSLTHIYVNYSASVLRVLGKFDDAERLLKKASKIDPLSLNLVEEIGVVQFSAGRYQEAVETLLYVSTTDAGYPEYLGRALAFAGRFGGAIAIFEKLDSLGHFYLGCIHAMAGRRSQAEKVVKQYVGFLYPQAVIYACLGENDRAFAALEQMAIAEPHILLGELSFPEFAGLRDDPRFAALRKKFRLP
jgi:serine/threonine-protein kinase